MKYTFKSHPTRYKNVLFRSRLEARWAAFFDLIKLNWRYEPFDLEGWTPDFETTENGIKCLCEIKPLDFGDEEQFKEMAGIVLNKIIPALPSPGCQRISLHGVSSESWRVIDIKDGEVLEVNIEPSSKEMEEKLAKLDVEGWIKNTWAEAGNLTMYRKPREY